MLSKVPDDCMFDILAAMHIPDIVRLRRTCKELHRITHTRIVWVGIYARLALHTPMPPIPSPHTLQTLPSLQLETLCISASKLHANWLSPIPSPTRLSRVAPVFEWYSPFLGDTPEPVKSIHLSPGGRWLVIFTVELSVHVCDLVTSVAYVAVRRTEVMQCNKEQLAMQDAAREVNVFLLHEMVLRVTWPDDITAKVCIQTMGVVDSFPPRVCAHQEWTIQMPRKGDPNHALSVASRTQSPEPLLPFLTTSLRAFPPTRYAVLSWHVDASAGFMISFLAHREHEIHVYDYERTKGAILYGTDIETLDGKTQCRVLNATADGQSLFVACIDGSMSIHIYHVALLGEADITGAYPRINVTPVAKDHLPRAITGSTRNIGAWYRRHAERAASDSPWHWQILTPLVLFTFTFMPQTHFLRRTETDLLTLSEVMTYSMHLQQSVGQRYWGRMGESRGVVVHEDGYRGRQVLKLVVPNSTDSTTDERERSDSSHNALADAVAHASGTSPPSGLRPVLGGLGAGSYVHTWTPDAAMTFDERTGRVCFLKLREMGRPEVSKPEFVVVDFAPKELVDMY